MELTIEQELQQGVAAHNAGNLQEAERAYQAILKSQPKHPDANHNLGLIAISVNEIAAALPLFKTALNVNPNIEQFWVSYIDALVKAKHLKDAKQAIKKAKKKGFDATKLQALFSQSKVNADTKVPSQQQLSSLLEYYQIGQYGDAEKLAKSIIQEFPKHQLGWKVLGALYGQTGRKSEALNANQTAVALSLEDAEAHSNLGITLRELGRFDEALASYSRAIALKPDYAEAHYNLGNTLKELGRLDEAEACYKQAIALKPDYAEAHYNLGNTLKELGRLDEAEACYTQAIALKPDYAQAHSNLGNTLKELGRLDEALAIYTQAIALKPDFAEAHSNLGNTLLELGRLDEALASHTQAIALKPDFLGAYDNIGFCYQAYIWANFSGKSEKINSLEEAIKLEKKKLKAKLKECPLWFVDVPRTSSKTISQIMWNQFGFPFGGRNIKVGGKLIDTTSPLLQNHTHAFIAKHVIGDEIWKEIQTFTIVRNPYDWCSSLWHYCRENETPDVTHDTFLGFLDSLELNLQANIYNRKINHKSFLQTDYLLDEDGKILVKHVLPFEDREKIIRQFRAMGINYSPEIHINKSKNSDYKMSDSERKRVEKIFAKDFEILGY